MVYMVVSLCGAEGRHDVANMLDPKASDRVAGDELVMFAPRIDFVEARAKVMEYSLAEAVQCWLSICFDERFRSTMTREYLACVECRGGGYFVGES